MYAPAWANGSGERAVPPTDPRAYADFARAASRRYPSVVSWLVWGEPNRAGNFEPKLAPGEGVREAEPRRYALLLDAAYGALSMDLYGHNPYTTRRPDLSKEPLIEGTGRLLRPRHPRRLDRRAPRARPGALSLGVHPPHRPCQLRPERPRRSQDPGRVARRGARHCRELTAHPHARLVRAARPATQCPRRPGPLGSHRSRGPPQAGVRRVRPGGIVLVGLSLSEPSRSSGLARSEAAVLRRSEPGASAGLETLRGKRPHERRQPPLRGRPANLACR